MDRLIPRAIATHNFDLFRIKNLQMHFTINLQVS